jgi:site-specific DNA recombinase
VTTTSLRHVRRAAIYCRISLDRDGGGLGIARQEQDCRELADRLGWRVVDVYPDNDISAYSGKPRPQWERLLADIRAGRADAVICWHVDRLTRSPRELEDVIDLADQHGLALATVNGDIDLGTPTGRMVARLLGAAARHESEHKGERQRRQARQAAEAGKMTAGGHRPFGFAIEHKVISASGQKVRRRVVGVRIDEHEAPIVRDCAARILSGESLISVATDLNARGVRTTTGGSWRTSVLRSMLASARISGRREHTSNDSHDHEPGRRRPLCGEIVADATDWPAIITPADSDRLRALLSRPERRTSPGSGRRYLLSGILVCGRCGHPMVCRPRSDSSDRNAARYLCRKDPGTPGCGRIMIVQQPTDDHIRELVLTALDSPELAQRLRRREGAPVDLHARIRADEDELEALAADHGAGDINRAEWKAARTPIAARLDAARAELATSTQTTALEGFVGTPEEMRTRWQAANLSQRRAVIQVVLDRVVVHPAVLTCFDPDRLDPVWRV